MDLFSFEKAPVPVRDAVAAALPRVWSHIGQPGTWLTAAQRVAVAAEARNARNCALCVARKEALSPYAVDGEHDSLGNLPALWVEVIHRIMTDPARIARHWYEEVTSTDLLTDRDYVEIVGVTVTVVAVDTLCRAVGMAPPALPTPQPGAPSRQEPDGLDRSLAYVPTLDPAVDAPLQREFYQGSAAHIRRALTYVPATARDFWDMAIPLYLSGPEMRDFDTEYRAISHAQIELVAGRVSAINQCVY